MLADAPGRRLLTRIAAVDHLRVHPHPSLGPALMRTFARARFAELPEDPDLFEGALRAVQALPEDAQQHALQAGLGPVLARLAFADLSRRWLALPWKDNQPPSNCSTEPAGPGARLVDGARGHRRRPRLRLGRPWAQPPACHVRGGQHCPRPHGRSRTR